MSTANQAAAPAPAPVSKGKIFFRRLLSTAVLWSVVLLALFSGNKALSQYGFLFIMVLLSVVGLLEFYGMVEKKQVPCFRGWGIVGGLILLVSTFVYLVYFPPDQSPGRINDVESSFLIIFVLGLCLLQLAKKGTSPGLLAISTTLLGLMYVPWLLNFMQKINFFPAVDGRFYLFYFIVVTKFSDVGAYAVGSLIGRHKMIPRISPGKTWEGFGGAILVSTGASLLFAHLAGERLAGMTYLHAAILGVLLSVTAVVGDLIESLFKREAGVKDSGAYFPGIGGILDLLDSLLFNAPLMYLYLRHVLT